MFTPFLDFAIRHSPLEKQLKGRLWYPVEEYPQQDNGVSLYMEFDLTREIIEIK
jgi:hypothetical protein